MSILIENISKQFGNVLALQNINLEIKSGSLTALVGPSGSGKSTLLRIVAGFEIPDSGRIWLFDDDSTYKTIQEREIGFVFQNYALFPYLTVAENIAFGLNVKKVHPKKIKERVKELLELIQLESFSDAFPNQLSGGQRQRVALARAIAVEPKLLLLDEPFGALDPKVRKDLRDWLKKLHSQVALTTLFVTHDQQEAMEVADQLVIFKDGKVEQFGTPQEIYDSPASTFVMNFLGNSNKIEKTTPLFYNSNANRKTNKLLETENEYYYRPHGFSLKTIPDEIKQEKLDGNIFSGKIIKIIYGESFVKLDIQISTINEPFRIQISRKVFQKFVENNKNIFLQEIFIRERKFYF